MTLTPKEKRRSLDFLDAVYKQQRIEAYAADQARLTGCKASTSSREFLEYASGRERSERDIENKMQSLHDFPRPPRMQADHEIDTSAVRYDTESLMTPYYKHKALSTAPKATTPIARTQHDPFTRRPRHPRRPRDLDGKIIVSQRPEAQSKAPQRSKRKATKGMERQAPLAPSPYIVNGSRVSFCRRVPGIYQNMRLSNARSTPLRAKEPELISIEQHATGSKTVDGSHLSFPKDPLVQEVDRNLACTTEDLAPDLKRPSSTTSWPETLHEPSKRIEEMEIKTSSIAHDIKVASQSQAQSSFKQDEDQANPEVQLLRHSIELTSHDHCQDQMSGLDSYIMTAPATVILPGTSSTMNRSNNDSPRDVADELHGTETDTLQDIVDDSASDGGESTALDFPQFVSDIGRYGYAACSSTIRGSSLESWFSQGQLQPATLGIHLDFSHSPRPMMTSLGDVSKQGCSSEPCQLYSTSQIQELGALTSPQQCDMDPLNDNMSMNDVLMSSSASVPAYFWKRFRRN